MKIPYSSCLFAVFLASTAPTLAFDCAKSTPNVEKAICSDRALGAADADMANAYAAARTHALVSFYETPGLASLEAVLAGATIVATDRGSPREYFGDSAFYCQPTDLGSIKAALSAAYAAKPDPALKQRVLSEYSWARTAAATIEGYRRAIEKQRRRRAASALERRS